MKSPAIASIAILSLASFAHFAPFAVAHDGHTHIDQSTDHRTPSDKTFTTVVSAGQGAYSYETVPGFGNLPGPRQRTETSIRLPCVPGAPPPQTWPGKKSSVPLRFS